jgi:hypothetical protein
MVPLDQPYVSHCWAAPDPPEGSSGYNVILPWNVLAFHRDYVTQTLVPEVIGFTVYTILFGQFAQL